MIVLRRIENESEIVDWRYVGNGEHRPVFKDRPIVRRCVYSHNESQAMLEKARTFAKQEGYTVLTGPDAWERAITEGDK